jgi:hypothetical protein
VARGGRQRSRRVSGGLVGHAKSKRVG